MAKFKDVEQQLERIGCNFRFWGRFEIRELANAMLPGERVEHAVNGIYDGGFALMAATDQRVMLVDKKPLFLTLEDVRYDMISELDYNHRLLNSTIRVCTPNKDLRFLSYNRPKLREAFHFVQRRVWEIRQYYLGERPLEEQSGYPLGEGQAIAAIPAGANGAAGSSGMSMSSPIPLQQPASQLAAAPAQAPAAQALPYYGDQPDQPSEADPFAPQFNPQQQSSPPQQATGVGPQQIGIAGMRRVVPVISAYTRLPIMSRHRRVLGSRQ